MATPQRPWLVRLLLVAPQSGPVSSRIVSRSRRIRLVVGAIAGIVLIAVPIRHGARHPALGLGALGYAALAQWADSVADSHPNFPARLISVVFGLGLLFACSVTAPSLYTAALLAYLVAVMLDTIGSGLLAGLQTAIASIVLALVALHYTPTGDRVSAMTLAFFAAFLLVVVVIGATLTADRTRVIESLERMQESVRSVTASPGLIPTLDSVTEGITDGLDAGFVGIFLRDGDRLSLAAPHNARGVLPMEDINVGTGDRSDRAGPIVDSVGSGRTVVVDDVRFEKRYPGWSERWSPTLITRGLETLTVVPLRAGDDVIGALVAGFSKREFAVDTHLNLVEAYANQAALVIVRAQAYEQVRIASERLEQADRIKSEFLATVSHELRTPLTAVKGFVDTVLLHWDRLGDDQRRAMLERASSNADVLARRIDQLLDLSRIEAGHIELLAEDTRLDELIDATITGLRPLLQDHRVVVDVAPGLRAWVDRESFAHILDNLVTNAVKFAPVATVVEVGARRDGGDAVVWVRDEGIGIPADEHERIFERFYRVSSPKGPRRGSGIGLAVVRRFVELHGGEVTVESEPGHGATFRFTLPVAAGTDSRRMDAADAVGDAQAG